MYFNSEHIRVYLNPGTAQTKVLSSGDIVEQGDTLYFEGAEIDAIYSVTVTAGNGTVLLQETNIYGLSDMLDFTMPDDDAYISSTFNGYAD